MSIEHRTAEIPWLALARKGGLKCRGRTCFWLIPSLPTFGHGPAIGHGKRPGHIRTLATTTTYTAFRWHADCTIQFGGIEKAGRKRSNDVAC